MATLMRTAATLALAAMLAACGTSSVSRANREGGGRETQRGAVTASEDLRLDALAPQALPIGACGLYLWAAATAAEPVFVFSALANPAAARISPNGRARTLERTAADGQSMYGHFESQTYSDGRLTVTIQVTYNTDTPLRDGATLRTASIRIRDRAGWETIIPAGGMIACQR